MYNPENYFTEEVLASVLKQYNWVEEYELHQSPPSSIVVKFPKCTIVITEGFESKMNAYFLNSEIGRSKTQYSLSIFDAVSVVKTTHKLSKSDGVLLDGLVRFLDVAPSLEKVIQGLRNICILLQVYLLPCIDGDFGWVDEYNKQNPS